MLKRWDAWPRNIRWLVGGIAAVVLVLAIAWALLVPIVNWLAYQTVGSVKEPLLQTARDAARGRLLTFAAGLFAVGALWFTARNFILSREGQVTDRYTKAIEQLGSVKLDVRIGAIYALERIARDSVTDRPTVMEVLAAFVRVHSPKQPEQSATDRLQADGSADTTPPDVQAAITVIGRRDTRRDRQRIDLRGANLGFADLADAFLSRARFTSADFTEADLTDADLSDADLGYACLVRAGLGRAKLLHANLSSADLTQAYLAGTDFTQADFTSANLANANLANANLRHANLIRVNLIGTYLSAADLASANLASANLTSANLANADLTDADLIAADLTNANLVNAHLTDADLTNADLTNADLTGADLTGAKWSEGSLAPRGWVRDPGSSRLMRISEGTP